MYLRTSWPLTILSTSSVSLPLRVTSFKNIHQLIFKWNKRSFTWIDCRRVAINSSSKGIKGKQPNGDHQWVVVIRHVEWRLLLKFRHQFKRSQSGVGSDNNKCVAWNRSAPGGKNKIKMWRSFDPFSPCRHWRHHDTVAHYLFDTV